MPNGDAKKKLEINVELTPHANHRQAQHQVVAVVVLIMDRSYRQYLRHQQYPQWINRQQRARQHLQLYQQHRHQVILLNRILHRRLDAIFPMEQLIIDKQWQIKTFHLIQQHRLIIIHVHHRATVIRYRQVDKSSFHIHISIILFFLFDQLTVMKMCHFHRQLIRDHHPIILIIIRTIQHLHLMLCVNHVSISKRRTKKRRAFCFFFLF